MQLTPEPAGARGGREFSRQLLFPLGIRSSLSKSPSRVCCRGRTGTWCELGPGRSLPSAPARSCHSSQNPGKPARQSHRKNPVRCQHPNSIPGQAPTRPTDLLPAENPALPSQEDVRKGGKELLKALLKKNPKQQYLKFFRFLFFPVEVHDGKKKGERKGEKKGEGKGKKEMKRERGNIHRWEKRGNWPTNPLALGLLKDEKSRQARAGIPAHTHSSWLAQRQALEMSPYLYPQHTA